MGRTQQLTCISTDEALAHLKILSQIESPGQYNLEVFRRVVNESHAFLGPDMDAWMDGHDLITLAPKSAPVSDDFFSRWILYTFVPFFSSLIVRRFRVRVP